MSKETIPITASEHIRQAHQLLELVQQSESASHMTTGEAMTLAQAKAMVAIALLLEEIQTSIFFTGRNR